MAQFYKMTLYICDLNDNLDIETIKMLINDRALDSISVHCITHYANEKVGENIEWDDNVDVNFSDSTTEQWENHFTH